MARTRVKPIELGSTIHGIAIGMMFATYLSVRGANHAVVFYSAFAVGLLAALLVPIDRYWIPWRPEVERERHRSQPGDAQAPVR